MTTKTRKWKDAVITVTRATVRHRLTVDAIQTKLADEHDTTVSLMSYRQFGTLLAQSVVSGVVEDIGFPFVSPTAEAVEIRSAYEKWLDSDLELAEAWQADIRTVNAPLAIQSEKKETSTP